MKLLRRQFLHLAAGALTLGVARAEDQKYVMKVSGPTINDTPHLFMKNFAAAVEKRFRRTYQARGLSGEPVRLDSPANRGHRNSALSRR